MHAPWIELIPPQDKIDLAGPGFSDYQWQALFACQIMVLEHQSWAHLKWGFNAAALFDEALERQKLFLESQYGIKNELRIENPNRRTLALRYINLPNEVLLLVMLGKIHARSKDDAEECALAYYRGLKSAFPYDYTLIPANSRDEFRRLSGWNILSESGSQLNIIQIKRCEVPILINQKSPFLQGLWQSSSRAHEQIWRSMAALPCPILINTTLRSTVIYDNDLQALWNSADEISKLQAPSLNQKVLIAYKEWTENFANRRLAPWQKNFYLQIHMASTQEIDEHLIRSVGTALTMRPVGHTIPGYQVEFSTHDNKAEWGEKIRNLDIILSGNYLPVPRLSEVADLDEVFAVMRVPYSPPDNGFPDVNFLNTKVD